jgi:hypothetical protein
MVNRHIADMPRRGRERCALMGHARGNHRRPTWGPRTGCEEVARRAGGRRRHDATRHLWAAVRRRPVLALLVAHGFTHGPPRRVAEAPGVWAAGWPRRRPGSRWRRAWRSTWRGPSCSGTATHPLPHDGAPGGSRRAARCARPRRGACGPRRARRPAHPCRGTTDHGHPWCGSAINCSGGRVGGPAVCHASWCTAHRRPTAHDSGAP